jgi:sortase (surface protein transpeptidase)
MKNRGYKASESLSTKANQPSQLRKLGLAACKIVTITSLFTAGTLAASTAYDDFIAPNFGSDKITTNPSPPTDTKSDSSSSPSPSSSVEPEPSDPYSSIPTFSRRGVEFAFNDVIGEINIPSLGTDLVIEIRDDGNANPADIESQILQPLHAQHYHDTELPGQVGNMVIGAHRGYEDAGFDKLYENLKPGDKAYIKTIDGYYTYTYHGAMIVVDGTNGNMVRPAGNGNMYSDVPSDVTQVATQPSLSLQVCPSWHGKTRNDRLEDYRYVYTLTLDIDDQGQVDYSKTAPAGSVWG